MLASGDFMVTPSRLFVGLCVLAACSLAIQGETWSQAGSARIKGNQIYMEKGCALCHAIHGKGGKAGPDLSEVGAKRDAEWLEQFLISPKAVVPQAKMPAFKGSAEERGALVAYLQSLR